MTYYYFCYLDHSVIPERTRFFVVDSSDVGEYLGSILDSIVIVLVKFQSLYLRSRMFSSPDL